MFLPASGPGTTRQHAIGVMYPSVWSACVGILRSFGFSGTDADGLGVGDAVTVTFVVLENILVPPNAKNSDPSASAPNTIATIILFRSFGDLPSKGFFTIYYCSCGCSVGDTAIGRRKYAAISNLRLT